MLSKLYFFVGLRQKSHNIIVMLLREVWASRRPWPFRRGCQSLP